jgi:Flp pilus assembly pilin Flp
LEHDVRFLSRFVKIEVSPLTMEYGLIACAMALALLALTPIFANTLVSTLAQ